MFVKTDDKHYKAIAGELRSYLGADKTYKPEQMASGIGDVLIKGFTNGNAEGYERGKSDGYSDGYSEGLNKGFVDGTAEGIEQGKQTAYDEFWDSQQANGSRKSCAGLYSGGGWNVDTFKPKHKLTPHSNTSMNMFYFCNYGNASIIDFRPFKHLFDFSSITNATYLFSNAWVDYIEADLSNATTLTNAFEEGYNPGKKTHLTLKISEKATGLSGAFLYLSKLTDLTFMEGSVIAASINLKDSPLNKASFESVFAALSPSATGKTATFKKTAKEAAFSNSEWETLKATKSNWTIKDENGNVL